MRVKAYSLKSVRELVAYQLKVADILHRYHIEYCDTYSEHTLVEEAYNTIRENADTIAEATKALGIIAVPTCENISSFPENTLESIIEKLNNAIIDITDALVLVDLVRETYANIRDGWAEANTICSIIDDCDKALVKVGYKLTIESGYFGTGGILTAKRVRPISVLGKKKGVDLSVSLPKIRPPRLDIRHKTRHDIAPKVPKPKLEKPKNPLSE